MFTKVRVTIKIIKILFFSLRGELFIQIIISKYFVFMSKMYYEMFFIIYILIIMFLYNILYIFDFVSFNKYRDLYFIALCAFFNNTCTI